VRRLLVALALLLLLALLVPRACQAIIGSGDDGESREDRGQEKAAGAGDTEDATAEKADTADDATDKKTADKKSSAGSEGTREDAEDQDDGAATDLGGVLTETLAERGAEPPGGSGSDQDVAASGDATTDQPAQFPVTLDASDQQPAPLQDATGAQLTPVAQRAPADRQGIGSPDMAAPAEKSPPGPRAALNRGLVVVDPAPRPVVRPRHAPAPDPVQIEVTPVPAAPVAATPGPPAPVTNDTAFAGGVVATNSFGGGAAGAPVDNAAAFAAGGVASNSFGGGAVVATGGFAGARGLP
jgi:hypothetical protein